MNRIVFVLTIILLPLLLFAQAGNFTEYSYEIDWEEEKIRIVITSPVPQSGKNLPGAALRVEREIETMIHSILKEAVSGIQVDSRQTGKHFLREDPELEYLFETFIKSGSRSAAVHSIDLSELTVRYEFPFSPELYRMFIRHEHPVSVPKRIEWYPTADFSGIVIYAKGELRVHGEDEPRQLEPCLFPRIFDEDMELILSKDMLPPDILARGGVNAYTGSLDEGSWQERIGLNPLRMIAEGIFGTDYTDIIISRENAGQILYSANNRSLLSQGKILVICDLE